MFSYVWEIVINLENILKTTTGVGEMAHLVHCLLNKPEDLNPMPASI